MLKNKLLLAISMPPGEYKSPLPTTTPPSMRSKTAPLSKTSTNPKLKRDCGVNTLNGFNNPISASI